MFLSQQHPATRGLWLVPHLLSLDAPAVALVWQQLLTSAVNVEPTLAGRALLALTVWAVYIADRIFDSYHNPLGCEPARHRFTRARRTQMALLLGVICIVIVCAMFAAPEPLILAGVLVGLAVIPYFVAVHAVRWKIPKEAAVAVLFACGVAISAWVRSQGDTIVILAAVGLAAVCWLNLQLINIIEGQRASSTGVFLIVAAGAIALTPLRLAVTVAILGLALVYAFREKLSPDAARVLADAVLLLPLPLCFV